MRTIFIVLLAGCSDASIDSASDGSPDLVAPQADPDACANPDPGTLTEECSVSCGASQRTGARSCVGGHWSPCSASCDCVEGSTRPCYTGSAATRGVGACTDGVQTCINGAFSSDCRGEVTPGSEICNGLDDNCDGASDEGLGTQSCGAGACRRTEPLCSSGKPVTCQPGTPSTEVCNGIDDDCDGSVDEGAPVVYTFSNLCSYSYIYMTFGSSYGTTCNACTQYCNQIAVAPGTSIQYTIPNGQCFYLSAYGYIPTSSGYFVSCLATGTVNGTDGQIHQFCADSCSPKSEPMSATGSC